MYFLKYRYLSPNATFSDQVKDRANGEFARVQGLARKMALNLGVDGAKNREAVVNIHR